MFKYCHFISSWIVKSSNQFTSSCLSMATDCLFLEPPVIIYSNTSKVANHTDCVGAADEYVNKWNTPRITVGWSSELSVVNLPAMSSIKSDCLFSGSFGHLSYSLIKIDFLNLNSIDVFRVKLSVENLVAFTWIQLLCVSFLICYNNWSKHLSLIFSATQDERHPSLKPYCILCCPKLLMSYQ